MKNLINNQKSLMISSLNENKLPEISYAPFVMIDKDIYVYLSRAANHYYNLANDKHCSVMIIEDEKDSKTIFARKRVSFECEATKLENVDETIYNKFDEVHDKSMMMVLKTLDFDIFKLNIKSGRLVKGFGQAFDINIKNKEFELIQVKEINHKGK